MTAARIRQGDTVPTDTSAFAGLNPLDAAGLHLVQALAHRSEALDWALRFLLTVNLVKLGVPVLLALYAWFAWRADEPPAARTRRVAGSFLGVVLAIGIGRALQDGLPPRPRPRLSLPDFAFPPLEGMPDLVEWSSMPSDHAVLAAALATAAWAYSWRLGLTAAIWVAAVTLFPRLYFGYHYLTDLLVGAAFGATVTTLTMALPMPAALLGTLAKARRQAPALLTLGFFLVAYEFVTLFETTRRVLGAMRDVAHARG